MTAAIEPGRQDAVIQAPDVQAGDEIEDLSASSPRLAAVQPRNIDGDLPRNPYSGVGITYIALVAMCGLR